MTFVLDVRGLSVCFGGVVAVDDVALSVAPGEVVAVIGPNGAGKSTLFNALTGMAPLKKGTIKLLGEPLQRRFGRKHALLAIITASLMALSTLALEVGPEGAFQEVVVRPFEVAYVAQHQHACDTAAAPLPTIWQRLRLMLLGAPSIGASWQGYQVWLPNQVSAGPPFATLSEAQRHAESLAQLQSAKSDLRVKRHLMALASGFVLGGFAFAHLFKKSRRSPDHIARMGVARTFQNIRLFGAMSVLDNVRVALGAAQHADRAAYALLKQVNLVDVAHSPSHALSYGDMRRLEIARALATRPALLLLDEPAAGMNATETMALQKLIEAIAKQGVAILLIEHDMQLVMHVASRIVVLQYGRKIADGPPDRVRADPKVIAAYLGDASERPVEGQEQVEAIHA